MSFRQRQPNRWRLAGCSAIALIAGGAITLGLAGAMSAITPLVLEAARLLPFLIPVLVVLVGFNAATPCGRWWESALDRHRRRRVEARAGEQTSP